MLPRNHIITLGDQGNFSWSSEIDATHRPIDTLADYGFLPDNGLLTNKIINEYGSMVFKDIQARMYHTELKTNSESAKTYRKKRSYWQAFKDISKRTEQSDVAGIQSNVDKAIYTERELAEHMVKMVRMLQPIEMLLNRQDLTRREMIAELEKVKNEIRLYQNNFPTFKFSDLPGLDGVITSEKDDLSDLVTAIGRLAKRLKDDTDNNAEIQKWLLKRFDQMNRGFEIRVRNVNIYKAAANTGGLTLGRAYDTVQNVKKLFRLTGHYYAESGQVSPEMQHRPHKSSAAFNSELYPLKKGSGEDHGNALKIAHYTAAHGDYTSAQEDYRKAKDRMVKVTRKRPSLLKALKAIPAAILNFGSSLKAKVAEERDFSFGKNWRTSTKLAEQGEALRLLTETLQEVAQSKVMKDSKPETSSAGIDEESEILKIDSSKADQKEEKTDQTPEMQFAYPSGSLQLAAMGDFFTSTSKFTENFIEFFAEEMADKRPFISVAAFSVYGLCGLTVFDPVMAKAVFGVVSKGIEEIAAGLAIQKLTGSPVVISPDAIVSAISKEATLIAEHLGSNASVPAKLITSSLVNMQGYVFTADFLGMGANENGFIREIIEQARTNHLTRESMLGAMQRYGLNVGAAAAILGIGMGMGLFASYLGTQGIPLDKVFELPLKHLLDPTLAPGAAFNASLITLKSVGAFYEAVYTAGSEVSRAGVPIKHNDIDYALLVMFLSNDLKKQLSDPEKNAVVQNQLRRLLREYPGLIKHTGMREVAERFNCVPAKSSWGATVIWGLTKPLIIAGTMLINLPRLAYHAIFSDKKSDGYQSALRSVVRGPIAGWLLLKRVATTGITFGRMLTRLAIEVSYRIVNKTMTLLDAGVTGIRKWFNNTRLNRYLETRNQIPYMKEQTNQRIDARIKQIEVDYVHRCQNRNARFVNLIGWLDDNFAKPVTNVLFRNAEQTTQLLLATGTVTRDQRKAMHAATRAEMKYILDQKENEGIRYTTQTVLGTIGVNRNTQPHPIPIVQANADIYQPQNHHTLAFHAPVPPENQEQPPSLSNEDQRGSLPIVSDLPGEDPHRLMDFQKKQ